MMQIEYPTISYAIPVCNEHAELKELLIQLNQFIDRHDQIIIQADEGNTTEEVYQVIDWFREVCRAEFDFVQWPLKNDFAQFKNNLKWHCRKDYVFQIDADELLGDGLCMNIHSLLTENGDNELYFIPRINIVKGLTQEYAESQQWNVRNIEFPIAVEHNEPAVNFPDRQARLFKNKPEIKWRNRVHEVVVGHKSYIDMAQGLHDLDPDQIQAWSLIHIKDLDRQKKQNEKYSRIIKSSYE
jgi:hypothetical protein